MKLSRLLPRYFAKTDNIRQLVEAVDSVIAEDDILNFFDNISVETNKTDLEDQIINLIMTNFYGTRINNFNLTVDEKKYIITIFAMLEDYKGNLKVITRLYKRFDWDVEIIKISANTFKVIPNLVTAPGTEEEFLYLAQKLNPFLEMYYIPIGFYLTSTLGGIIVFPTYVRTRSVTLTTSVVQNLYAHRFFGNYQLLNENPLEFEETDYGYVTEFTVVDSP